MKRTKGNASTPFSNWKEERQTMTCGMQLRNKSFEKEGCTDSFECTGRRRFSNGLLPQTLLCLMPFTSMTSTVTMGEIQTDMLDVFGPYAVFTIKDGQREQSLVRFAI